MRKRYFIAIDIGTSGAKAGVFDEDGILMGLEHREYRFSSPRPGWSEIDPDLVWKQVTEATRGSVERTGLDPRQIVALGLSVLGETSMGVDEYGTPVYPAIESMDKRDSAYGSYVAWFGQRLGAEAIFRRTSYPLSSLSPVVKILWLRDHRPELFARVAKFVTFQDYAVWQLTGAPAIDHSMASRTMLFDAHSLEWIPQYMAEMELSPQHFSLPVDATQVVGGVRPEVATSLGLLPGTPVVAGAHDQSCAALGIGIVREGTAGDGTGSVEAIATLTGKPITDPAALLRGHGSQCHVGRGLYLALGFHLSAGSLVRWYRDQLGRWELELAREQNRDPYDIITEAAEASPPGANGLMVLPHWSGAGTGRAPALDPRSRGVILGLSLSHTKSDISRALFEGITYETRHIIESMEAIGIPITELKVTGGGAKSSFWLQLKADITGRRIVVPQVTEASLLGAAMLAGVGAGIYRDLQAAVDRVCRVDRAFEPNLAAHARYDRLFPVYRDVYDATLDLSSRLAEAAR